MKKFILTTGAMTSVFVPVITIVSCGNNKTTNTEVRELKSEYQVNSPNDLLEIFKDANYNVGESEARNFYIAFSALKPASPIKVTVHKGQKQMEGYDSKSVYLIASGISQVVLSKQDLSTVDPEIISVGMDDEKLFNIASAYNEQLSQKEISVQAPILFDNFGITQDQLKNASFGFLLTTKNGKNATVSMQQFKKAEVDQTATIYSQVGKFSTNIIGQIPADTSEDKTYEADVLGHHDFTEIDNNYKQYNVAKNTNAPSAPLYKEKLKEALEAANNHINNLFDSRISKQEKIDNKGKTRYFRIDEDRTVHWIEDGIDYLIQIKDTEHEDLPQLFNFITAIKLSDKSIVHDENYYKTNIEGPKWKEQYSNGTFGIAINYVSVHQYLLGFASLNDNSSQLNKTISGLSLAKPEWIQ